MISDLVDMGFSAAGGILYGAGTAPPIEAGAEGTSAPRRGLNRVLALVSGWPRAGEMLIKMVIN